MAKEIILKIKDIGISRSYGFNNGGYIVVGHYYKNHKPVKDAQDILFSERSTIVEQYAIACGIRREVDLDKLIGKEVCINWEYEDGYDYAYLTRPYSISKKLGLDPHENIVGVCRGAYEEEEAV